MIDQLVPLGLIALLLLGKEGLATAKNTLPGASLNISTALTSTPATMDSTKNNYTHLNCRSWPCNVDEKQGKPLICIEGGDKTVLMSQRVEIQCKVAHNKSNIELMVDGKPAQLEDFFVKKENCKTTFTIIHRQGCYNLKTFSCNSKNSYGTSRTNNISIKFEDALNVFQATQFFVGETKENTSKHLIAGTKGMLTCSCPLCKQSTEYNFYFKSDTAAAWTLINENIYRRFDKTRRGRGVALFISNVTKSDAKTYGCDVVNIDYNGCVPLKQLNVQVGECRTGHYCSQHSWKEFSCPGGTYNPVRNLFNKSGCLSCPQGKYCPAGSLKPLPCKEDNVFSGNSQLFPLHPAITEEDCRRCPLRNSCSSERKCALVCTTKPVISVWKGEFVELRCKTSLNSSVQDMELNWRKSNQKINISKNGNYVIRRSKDFFTLSIQSAEIEDSGRYTCEGIHPGYRNIQKSDMVLQVKAKGFNQKFFYLLFLVLPVLVIVTFIMRWKRFALYCTNSKGKLETQNSQDSKASDSQDGFVKEKEVTLLCKTEEDKSSNMAYDAFVCYSHKDKAWVRKQLLPELENQGINVCIHFRDFNAGGHVLHNIVNAIYNSRKTLAILSPDFLQSEWCNYELQQAITRMGNHIIPVLFRPCEVPKSLRHTTYLDWTNEYVRPVFWQRLIKTIKS